MTKVVSTVIRERFTKFRVFFPDAWEQVYVPFPYTEEQLIDACWGADFLLVNSTHPVTRRVIESSPSLKLIHTEGVGFNRVDVDAARECGIPVCNNRATNNDAVAEHTIGLILAGLRRTAYNDLRIRQIGFGATQQEFLSEGQRELKGQHVGLIGIGAIGKEVAKRLAPWGCRVSYYDAFRPSPELEAELHVAYLPLDELIRDCDVISMHVPVLPTTVDMISFPQFAAMKKNALLINTARGEVVNNAALVDALETGKIYGACLDTLYPEPPAPDHPLLTLSPEAARKLTVTPHAGGTTDEAFTRMLNGAIGNMLSVERGDKPVNVVNE